MDKNRKVVSVCFFVTCPATLSSGFFCWNFFYNLPFANKQSFQLPTHDIQKIISNIKILGNKYFWKIINFESINEY